MTRTSSSSLSEQAARELADMILVDQRFKPGDKLPNELELAQELGISRVTLREAIRVLCTQGLVEIRRGRGTYVLTDNPVLSPAAASLLEIPGASLRDLLEIRMMVEPMAAYYAAKRASDAELQQIDLLRMRIEDLAAKNEPVLQEEQEFHNAIALASQNALMRRLLPLINRSIITDITYFEESIPYSLKDHSQITYYLKARNADGARTSMKMHILHIYQISGLDLE